MVTRRNPQHFALLAALVLAVAGITYLVMGLRAGWDEDGRDLGTREREWSEFRQHVYPNVHLKQPVKAKVHTVYPPWALPMFGIFLGSDNFSIARLILQASSLMALGTMMWMGWRELAPHGWHSALAGAAMATAIAGNYTALRWGQFSILCSGLLAGQIIALQSGRHILAGLCWAIAMLKPQIALPFALLFLLYGSLRSLVVGSGVLVALSTVALWWTSVTPLDYLNQGVGGDTLRWVRTAKHAGVSTLWVEWFNLNPRIAMLIGLGLMLVASATLLLKRRCLQVSLLSMAGICAVLGHILFYHRRYDDPMLYPLILAITVRVHTGGWRMSDVACAVFLGLTLFPPLPTSFVSQGGFLSLLIVAAPIVTALRLLIPLPANMPTRRTPAGTPDPSPSARCPDSQTSLPSVGIVMPTHGPLDSAAPALRALSSLDPQPSEVVVVTDSPASTEDATWLPPGCLRIGVPHASGPAVARNAGAAHLGTDIVLFVDSDVVVPRDTIQRFAEQFRDHPGHAAVFGSYDSTPADPGFLSQYRNLLHHFVHQTARQEASTFWSGLGAVRREIFQKLGGFDESYRVPSIEDVELGCRLVAAGHRIRLVASLQACHLKRWTALGILRTDLLQRGVPWVRLALSGHGLPPDLNLGWTARLSVLLAGATCTAALAGFWWPTAGLAVAASLGGLLYLNRAFHRFLLKQRGFLFAAAAFPWQILYHLECGAAAVIGLTVHLWTASHRARNRTGAHPLSTPPTKSSSGARFPSIRAPGTFSGPATPD